MPSVSDKKGPLCHLGCFVGPSPFFPVFNISISTHENWFGSLSSFTPQFVSDKLTTICLQIVVCCHTTWYQVIIVSSAPGLAQRCLILALIPASLAAVLARRLSCQSPVSAVCLCPRFASALTLVNSLLFVKAHYGVPRLPPTCYLPLLILCGSWKDGAYPRWQWMRGGGAPQINRQRSEKGLQLNSVLKAWFT